jgi:AraC-like DNA-binding protein
MSTPPLEKWPALRTFSVDEAEHALRSIYGASNFAVRKTDKPFSAHANYKALNAISFSYCSYSNPVTIRFPEAPFYRQAFSVGGAGRILIGRHETLILKQHAHVVPVDVPLTADFGEEFQQLLLRVDEAALFRKLSALIGAAPKRKIEFRGTARPEERSLNALHRLITYVVSEIDASPDMLPLPALAELEQAVLVTFLLANPHNFSDLLHQNPRDLEPWQVRRAEEYIEANWDDAMTVESIAEAVDASARSIFLSFRQARGYSPMAFLKKIRLQHARQKMLDATPETTVTGVALECGFHNMGHFANGYRKQFGESPSETLKRAKGRKLIGN